MAIRLTIDNAERLPQGHPSRFSSAGSFRIGRDNCEWTLPDPNRHISGVHCEIRLAADGFWLYDVSRNGTFLNGSITRIASPHRLGTGDRLRVGRYVISVALDDMGPQHLEGQAEHNPSPAERGDANADALGVTDAHAGDVRFPRLRAPGEGKAELPVEPSLPPKPAPALDSDRILREIAVGAGVSPDIFLQRDAREVAAEIGMFLKIVVDELASLLKARAAAKVLARSNNRTVITSTGNNPLKFVPGAEEMIEKMFARRGQGYLDARRSLEEAFGDLKTHEVATYAAMQSALAALLDELSPEAVERRVVASAFASKKVRAWDEYIRLWESKEQGHENGMLDAFLEHFSDAYVKASKPK